MYANDVISKSLSTFPVPIPFVKIVATHTVDKFALDHLLVASPGKLLPPGR